MFVSRLRRHGVCLSPGALRAAAGDGVRLGEVARQAAADAHAAVVDAALGVGAAWRRVAGVDATPRVSSLKQQAQLTRHCTAPTRDRQTDILIHRT